MKYKLELQQTRTQNRPVTKEQVVSEGILGIEPRTIQLGDSTPNTLNQGFQSVLDSKETKTLFFLAEHLQYVKYTMLSLIMLAWLNQMISNSV